MHTLDSMLSHMPVDVLSEGGGSNTLKFKSDAYYASIVMCYEGMLYMFAD